MRPWGERMLGRSLVALAFALAVGLLPALSPVVAQALAGPGWAAAGAPDPTNPTTPVKLVFVHHSTGEAWLGDGHGQLGLALAAANYFVSDTSYGWGPADADVGSGQIGDHTDIGHWYNWFAGPNRDTYLAALYTESGQWAGYSRMATDPGGENQLVMIKSCFPNSHIGGNPTDPPVQGANPLRGQDSSSGDHTVANIKGIYQDLLGYFATRQDRLFVVVTAPPLEEGSTTAEAAANARAVNNWLTSDWLASYPYANVVVFDFYTVLTSSGGDVNTNDLGALTGNHHRFRAGAIEHVTTGGTNYSAYYTSAGDSHPTAAGDLKATGEFLPLLNIAYNRWQASLATPSPTATATVTPIATATETPTPTATATPTPTPAPLYLPAVHRN